MFNIFQKGEGGAASISDQSVGTYNPMVEGVYHLKTAEALSESVEPLSVRASGGSSY